MTAILVDTDAMRRYGAASAAMSTAIATAGNVDQAANIAAAVPVFGLIGQDFLLAFAIAQANHLSSVDQLAGVHAATAVAAYGGANTYEASEQASAAGFRSVGRQ